MFVAKRATFDYDPPFGVVLCTYKYVNEDRETKNAGIQGQQKREQQTSGFVSRRSVFWWKLLTNPVQRKQ